MTGADAFHHITKTSCCSQSLGSCLTYIIHTVKHVYVQPYTGQEDEMSPCRGQSAPLCSVLLLFNLQGFSVSSAALQGRMLLLHIPSSRVKASTLPCRSTSGCVSMCPCSGPARQPGTDNYSLVFISVRCWPVRGSCRISVLTRPRPGAGQRRASN